MILRNAVVILGAGASKGAALGAGRTPPLDSEFLSRAADCFRGKRARGPHREAVTAWKSFRDHLQGAGLDFKEVKNWRLEQLSTFLEARASLKSLKLDRGRPRDYAEALEALKVAAAFVLVAEGGTRECKLHRELFRAVRPLAVLSFNYDLIADQSLLASSLLNWRSKDYRGASRAEVPTERGSKYVLIRDQPGANGTPLLKLHGSINWEKVRRGDGFRLSGCQLPQREGETFKFDKVPRPPYIVPPVAAKIQIAQRTLRDRWRLALRYLHDAPSWIIWGYSFPTTDTISQVLFRTALSRNRKPKPVLVINPDATVPARVKEVCRKVKVSHVSSVERLLLDEGNLRLDSVDDF